MIMFDGIVRRDFFRDRTALVASIVALGMAVLIIIRVLFSVQQFSDKVPIRYTQFDIEQFERGDWYSLYELAGFAFLTTAASIVIAMRLHREKRDLAVAVLGLQLVVLIFAAFVSNALLNIPPVVS